MNLNATPHNNHIAPETPPKLLTRHEAAHALSSCLRTVDEAIASGDLEIIRIGRSVRIRPSALEDFIEARATRRDPMHEARMASKRRGGNQ